MAKYVYNRQGQMIQRKGILSGIGTMIAFIIVFIFIMLAIVNSQHPATKTVTCNNVAGCTYQGRTIPEGTWTVNG